MTTLEFPTHDLSRLRQTRDALALEFFDTAGVLGSLKRLLPGVISDFKSFFTGPGALRHFQRYDDLSKQENAFLRLMDKFEYVNVREIRAFRPEGMSSPYVAYLQTLLTACARSKDLMPRVLQPYQQYLAQLVARRDPWLSADAQTQPLQALEASREALYQSFGTHYQPGSYRTECKVKDVIERKADWVDTLSYLNQCQKQMEAIDRNKLEALTRQCAEALELIYAQLARGSVDAATQELAQRLSNGAYQVAKELEFYATTHYRVLTMLGALKQTMQLLTERLD